MILVKLCSISILLQISQCDWVADWMSGIQEQLEDADTTNGDISEQTEAPTVPPMPSESPEVTELPISYIQNTEGPSTLKKRLDDAIEKAVKLANVLREHIAAVNIKERVLKEAIAKGRSGTSTLTVFMMSHAPRSYIVRDGIWTLCDGYLQTPAAKQGSSVRIFNGLFASPRCIGQEIATSPDPCVFNSVIKYEVIPSRRALEYVEDEFLCLKPNFNNTIERYMSVPLHTINDTCKNGVVRKVKDNSATCGIRILTEYSYYPHRSTAAAQLPLEYCTEEDGSCRFVAAWHISNATIENFEFLRPDNHFKKFFIKTGPYLDNTN